LLESELFGHEKGAFTGALCARTGRIEEAEGGTLFLDEIGDLSPSVQLKLLRVLQEREYERVGSNKTVKANMRMIAATSRDLEGLAASGLFRQDLFYRINVFPIVLPPLSERQGDILLLADHFVAKYAKKMGKNVRRISTPAINMLFAYHWPGNVRELENCIEYAVLLATDEVIHGHNLPPTLQLPDTPNSTDRGLLKTRVDLLERDMITDALKRSGGKVSLAAEQLGITSRMVRYKMKRLGIQPAKRQGFLESDLA
jgi:Nif-specific regulatory protein